MKAGLDLAAHARLLRHTFAVVTLDQLQHGHIAALGQLTEGQRGHYTRIFGDPLNWVRRRLGHRSVVTTQIYLHALAELEMHTRMRLVPDGCEDPREIALAERAAEVLRRFVRFLDTLAHPPVVPQQLTAAHVDAYMRRRVRTIGAPWAWHELIELRMLFQCPPLPQLVPAGVGNYLSRRVGKRKMPSLTDYSAGEMARLVTAARNDVAAIRDRLDAGDRLLATWRRDPGMLSAQEQEIGALLAQAAQTGVVPCVSGRPARTALAQRLFVTRRDREPLLVLLAAVTGRNSEPLKELPAEHRVLEGAAVEQRAVKRRHGPRRWFDTITWEIGPAHRELHTPGGLYLLLHRLMARGRALSGSQTVWSEWQNGIERAAMGQLDEHRDPYGARLSAGLNLKHWAARHDLRADSGSEQGQGAPLAVGLRRIRTTVEVSRTRAAGGHLPSAGARMELPSFPPGRRVRGSRGHRDASRASAVGAGAGPPSS